MLNSKVIRAKNVEEKLLFFSVILTFILNGLINIYTKFHLYPSLFVHTESFFINIIPKNKILEKKCKYFKQ